MNRNDFIIIKCAGGAGAQTLALMNAIYLQKKFEKKFRIRFYPYSTGTYWPFAIKFLLNDEEVETLNSSIKGLRVDNSVEVGKIIKSHPLIKKGLTYEKFLFFLRKYKLESKLMWFRREYLIEASTKKLASVPLRAKYISGGYAPILDSQVCEDLDSRFKNAGINSPFSKSFSSEETTVVIHYRIGDKRTSVALPTIGSDGVLDPLSFKLILGEIKAEQNFKLIVVSDEPKVACKLLSDIGIEINESKNSGNIWEDIFTMSQADYLLGSWSQVSQLAGICTKYNGGSVYLPTNSWSGEINRWEIDGFNYYKPLFLDSDHEIYVNDFLLEDSAHNSYKNVLSASKPIP